MQPKDIQNTLLKYNAEDKWISWDTLSIYLKWMAG